MRAPRDSQTSRFEFLLQCTSLQGRASFRSKGALHRLTLLAQQPLDTIAHALEKPQH